MARNIIVNIHVQAILLCFLVGWAGMAQSAELVPGTYRCSAYNVSGGGGSCRNQQPIALHRNGSYRHSSTQGRWRIEDGRLVLSESRLWGSGEILDPRTVRFEYEYRGWQHTVTWVCQESAAGNSDTAQAAGRSSVGVSLTLAFGQSIGGVSGYAIVPAKHARSYTHNAPLPGGAVQGSAWETSANTVSIATNRNTKLLSGRRYVVFLSWPRETIAVAVLDLPQTDRDYTATLAATLDGASVLSQTGGRSAPVTNAPAEPARPSEAVQHQPAGAEPARNSDQTGAQPPAAKCNPLIPRYSQPGCIE